MKVVIHTSSGVRTGAYPFKQFNSFQYKTSRGVKFKLAVFFGQVPDLETVLLGVKLKCPPVKITVYPTCLHLEPRL